MEGRLFRSFKSHLPNQNYLGTMVGKRVLSLENLVGTFLLELKKRAEKHFQRTFDSAILGRPARYSMDEVAEGFALHRMKRAAEFAGFKQVSFVPEPLAAALEYRKEIHEPKILLIGDFGGGTSDFTVLRVSPGSFRSKDVLSVEGCPLAGDALDSVFMSERLNQSFGAKSLYKLPLSGNILEMPKPIMERLNKPAHIVHLKEPETYNFIKQNSEFLGGSIAPGLDMRFQSMHGLTAKLPLIGMEWNFPLIGYDTKTNLLSGVAWGMAKEIDGIIDAYSEKFGNFNVLLTGGNTLHFAPLLKNMIFADPHLIFKGLYAISELNR
jgi:hypothetical protein